MIQPIHLDDVVKRPLRYWNQDGMEELMFGIISVAMGAICLVVYPRRSSIPDAFLLAGPTLLCVSIIVGAKGLKRLKALITFPRGGYVAYHEPTRRFRAYPLAVFAVGFILALLNRGVEMKPWGWIMGPGMAILFALFYLFCGLWQQATHMVWLGAFSLLLAAWMYRIEIGPDGGLWVMVWVGGAMALSGALRLRGFLKVNPLPAE